MRFIYMDETGTNAYDPVMLVCGLIVQADTEWVTMSRWIKTAISRMPARFRDGFVFHATEVWSDDEYRAHWDAADRFNFMQAIMMAPRAAGARIAFSMERRFQEPVPDYLNQSVPEGISVEVHRHAANAAACIYAADKFIRETGVENEIGILVVEEVDHRRRQAIRHFVDLLYHRKVVATEADGTEVRLDLRRIVDTIHYAPKEGSIMLWAADAVAYGLRRYFAGAEYGEEYAKAILGPQYKEMTQEIFHLQSIRGVLAAPFSPQETLSDLPPKKPKN